MERNRKEHQEEENKRKNPNNQSFENERRTQTTNENDVNRPNEPGMERNDANREQTSEHIQDGRRHKGTQNPDRADSEVTNKNKRFDGNQRNDEKYFQD
ncbi:MAG TPA: hypothetical protein VKY33_06035 [Flavobacterium sp.]|nr:hypothetical protein [Flavobacterium sp.]